MECEVPQGQQVSLHGLPAAWVLTAMVSVAPKDEEAAQMVLLTCTAETQAVYHRSAASKMGRWLMLDITSPEMLEDVKALLAVRVKPAE